jgi:DNA-binding GntR family transcriptional regulator
MKHRGQTTSANADPDISGSGEGAAVVAGVIHNRRLSDQIYDIVLAQLRAGAYGLDTLITEPAVASALRTSRTPVREALFRLAGNGVLAERGRGYRLPVLTHDEVGKLFSVRTMIEVEIIRQAADRVQRDDIVKLKRCVARERKAAGIGVLEFIAANNAMRRALFSPCDNPYLTELADLCNDRMQAYRVATLAKPENRRSVVALHARVVDLLENGERERAVAAYRELMDAAAASYAEPGTQKAAS